MNFSFQQTSLKFWRRFSKGLLSVVLVLSTSQLMTLYALLDKEVHWVLIPQVKPEERMEVSTTSFSKDYIVRWSDGLLNSLLSVSIVNANHRMEEALKLTSSAYYGTLQKTLSEEVAKLQKMGATTVFYPKTFEVFEKRQEVYVTGSFYTYYANDRQPVIEEKTWVLGWKKGPTGVILLNKFEEKGRA